MSKNVERALEAIREDYPDEAAYLRGYIEALKDQTDWTKNLPKSGDRHIHDIDPGIYAPLQPPPPFPFPKDAINFPFGKHGGMCACPQCVQPVIC